MANVSQSSYHMGHKTHAGERFHTLRGLDMLATLRMMYADDGNTQDSR